MVFLRILAGLIFLLLAFAAGGCALLMTNAPGFAFIATVVAIVFGAIAMKLFMGPAATDKPVSNGLSEREVEDHLKRTADRHIRQLEREAQNRETQRKADNGRDKT
jgi:hypothetical protein